MFKNGKKHDFHVGTIVGRTFINEKYYSFSHKDGDFTNNNVKNLEPYCTRQKVILHLANGTTKSCKSLQVASKYLGYNVNYLSAYLSKNNQNPYVIINNILICYLEFKEGD